MNMNAEHDSPATVETHLTHEAHRLATSLLVDASPRPSVPHQALARLRDFLVVNLRHHHDAQDEWLWPHIAAAAPEAKPALDDLTEQHKHLDITLTRLADIDLDSRNHRQVLHEAAVAVRDSVHDHLTHEEPVLFPALREHTTPWQWKKLSRRVIATTPPAAGHLMIGLLDEVATPAELRSILANMPPPVKARLPAIRTQAATDLQALRTNSP
ncbi:hemerythrin domain-containing protein [Streptomyces malaysiensis]|uniref:hemerythrin domain-containing protein n=1 Tax=Streptomyces malaysiensis TaxID=92644 RepID=UPI002B305833|nr:hemerythrin domain-containing protein [Streptomyces malaysiensis]